MLTEKRYEVILNLLNEKNSVTVTEIKELLGISESTIRRDLAAYSARTAHPFQRNGALFRFKLSKAQQVY